MYNRAVSSGYRYEKKQQNRTEPVIMNPAEYRKNPAEYPAGQLSYFMRMITVSFLPYIRFHSPAGLRL